MYMRVYIYTHACSTVPTPNIRTSEADKIVYTHIYIYPAPSQARKLLALLAMENAASYPEQPQSQKL